MSSGARLEHGFDVSRLGMAAATFAFRVEYRAAFERWRAGERDVVFPPGTYAMRVRHGVTVAPFS